MNRNKPPYLQTHTLFKRLGELLTFGCIAGWCGKEIQTVEAWARPVATNEHPTGTGKNNPMDCILRLMGKAHEKDAGLSREIAECFTSYSDYLDGKITKQESLHKLIGSSVKEHADVLVELLNTDQPDWNKANTELVQAEIALRKLREWVKEEQRMHAPLAVVAGGK